MNRLKLVLLVAALALPAPSTLWGQDEESDVEAATLAVEGMVSEEDVKLMIKEAVAAALKKYRGQHAINYAFQKAGGNQEFKTLDIFYMKLQAGLADVITHQYDPHEMEYLYSEFYIRKLCKADSACDWSQMKQIYDTMGMQY